MLGFSLELGPPLRCEVIELRGAASFGRLPFAAEEATVFEVMQCGVQRTRVDLQDIARDLLDSPSDRVAVDGTHGGNPEDEQDERALRQVRPLAARH